MSPLLSLTLYSSLMAILSFLAGLPSFWFASKSSSALPALLQLTSGLLLSAALTIVLPEALQNLSDVKVMSSRLGPEILLGFVTLYFVDMASSVFSNHLRVSTSSSDEQFDLDNDNDNGSTLFSEPLSLSPSMPWKDYAFSVISNSTTLGLVLHCLTDGIILATSVISMNDESGKVEQPDNHDVKSNFLVIIAAIFLHKLPASFSLTSILLNKGLPMKLVLFHLVLFSVAAPIGAWITYLLSSFLSSNQGGDSNSFIMLFSTGAFLYVGFHTFISIHEHSNEADPQKGSGDEKRFIITVIGMIIPVLVSFLHDD